MQQRGWSSDIPQRGILVATPECRIQFANTKVQQWLKRYFRTQGDPIKLPTSICTWLGNEASSSTTRPLVVTRGHQALIVSRLRPHPRDSIALVLELLDREVMPRSRTQGGLTPREAEVIHWVAAGKSDKDVAEILNITAATVGKHLERIYPKLGVENRVAASNVWQHAHANDQSRSNTRIRKQTFSIARRRGSMKANRRAKRRGAEAQDK